MINPMGALNSVRWWPQRRHEGHRRWRRIGKEYTVRVSFTMHSIRWLAFAGAIPFTINRKHSIWELKTCLWVVFRALWNFANAYLILETVFIQIRIHFSRESKANHSHIVYSLAYVRWVVRSVRVKRVAWEQLRECDDVVWWRSAAQQPGNDSGAEHRGNCQHQFERLMDWEENSRNLWTESVLFAAHTWGTFKIRL